MRTLVRTFYLLLLCLSAHGAIAPDNTIDLGSGSATTLSASFTVSGANRALVVVTRSGGTNNSYITGVTYNGVAATLVVGGLNNGAGTVYTMWYLSAPATGPNTLTVSAGGGSSYSAVAHSYTGVSQSGQPENSASYTGTGGNAVLFNATLTTTAANAWLIFGGADASANPFTVSSGNGETGSHMTTNSGGVGLCDRGPMATPGSNSISMTIQFNGTANAIAGGVISLAPVAGTTAIRHRVTGGLE